jgi:hypothetical protein
MYYSESSIAAIHEVRTERLHAETERRIANRAPGLRSLVSRGLKALIPARTPQPVHNG